MTIARRLTLGTAAATASPVLPTTSVSDTFSDIKLDSQCVVRGLGLGYGISSFRTLDTLRGGSLSWIGLGSGMVCLLAAGHLLM